MKKLALHWKILIGLVLGVIYGILFREHIEYVSWMGVVFLRGLKMVIVPLILSSIISGITNVGGAGNLGRLGLKTMGYYVMTSLIAIITGLFFVNAMQPGVDANIGLTKEVEGLGGSSADFINTLINIVPENIFQAFANNDMLAIIFFAIVFGFFITQVERKHKTFMTDLFNATFEVMMKVTMFVIKLAPFGIFGIIANAVAEAPSLTEFAGRMGVYMLTVIASLFFHAFISLPLLLKFLGKVKPTWHMKNMTTPLLTAFSTASSSATLPLTMEAVEHKSGASNKVTSFTLPLGATINMDGTALYECVAAIFIAQAYGVELSVFTQAIIVLTALLSSIGAAGIPMAGFVMISVILTAAGLPLEGVGLILAVDPLLDMFRTATNVWSDSCGAIIIAKSEGEDLNIDDQ